MNAARRAADGAAPVGPVARLLRWPVRRPMTVLLVAAACAVAAVFGVTRLRFDASLEAMFSERDPAAVAMVRVLNQFAVVDELILLASTPPSRPGDPDQLTAFAARLQTAIERDPKAAALSRGVTWKAGDDMRRFMERVMGPSGLFYLDDATFAAAQQRLSKQGMQEQLRRDEEMLGTPGPASAEMAKLVRKDPLRLLEFILPRLAGQNPFRTLPGSEAIISPDGRTILIRVAGARPTSDLEFCKQFTSRVAAVVDRVNTEGLQVEYTGAYPIAAASERAIRHDMTGSITGSIICLQALFLLAYRNPVRLFAMAFGPVALGVLFGFAASAAFGLRMSPLTAVIGAILAGMGIDYSVQYLACYERHRAEGLDSRAAAEAAVGDIGSALLAAWATSVIGFLAIGWSSVKAIQDFALVGTLGLAGSFVCAITVLPALLALSDGRNHAPSPQGRSRLRFRLDPLIVAIQRRLRACMAAGTLALVAAVTIICWPGGEVLPLEESLNAMHPWPNPPLEALAHLADRFGSTPGGLVVHLEAGSATELVELSYKVHERLSAGAVRDAGVVSDFGLASLLPDPRLVPARLQAMRQVDVERVVADFRAAVEDSAFEPSVFQAYPDVLRHLLTASSAPTTGNLLAYPEFAGKLLPRSASDGIEPMQAVTVLFTRGTLESRAQRDAAVRAVREVLAGVRGATLTGLPVVSYDAERTIHRDLPRFLIVAAVLTVGYLLAHFRSVRASIVSLLPTIFGLLVLLAAARTMHLRLNMVNLVALPLLIGIDVDYGIFMVSLARRRLGGHDGAAVRQRLASSGNAVVVCAASVILGFGSLAFTSVPAVCSLGVMVTVGVIACVAGAFMLLVPLVLGGDAAVSQQGRQ